MTPTVADFTSQSFAHEVVHREEYDYGECQRFHLSFAYLNGRGGVSLGDQVVAARDIGQAAWRIASERGVDQLFVRNRFYSNKPASKCDAINTVFDCEAVLREPV